MTDGVVSIPKHVIPGYATDRYRLQYCYSTISRDTLVLIIIWSSAGIVPFELYDDGDGGNGGSGDYDLGVPSFAQMHKYVPAVSALVCVVSFCICICVVIQRR